MWHKKIEEKTLFDWSDELRCTVEVPYLENDEGVVIRKIGGLRKDKNFNYSAILENENFSFNFWAYMPWSKDHPVYDTYQVDLSSVMNELCASHFFDNFIKEEIVSFLNGVMTNIREALFDFPRPIPTGPHSVPEPAPIVDVTFHLSLWNRWKEFKAIDFGEHIL